jgi:hypothetical protein
MAGGLYAELYNTQFAEQATDDDDDEDTEAVLGENGGRALSNGTSSELGEAEEATTGLIGLD